MALLQSSSVFCVSGAVAGSVRGSGNSRQGSTVSVVVVGLGGRSSRSSSLQSAGRGLFGGCGVGGSTSKVGVLGSQKRDGVEQELATSLVTEGGISLQVLRDKLAAGEWEAADAETRRLLCELAGEEAAKRKWVYFSEVKFISVSDLRMVDSLWRQYSNDKFGYSVQRKIWNNVGKTWNAFFKKVGWTRPLDEYQDTYKKFPLEFMWDVADPTPEGHLPLTNALRGTRLLEEVLNHAAFADVDHQQKLKMEPELLSGLFGKSR